MSNGNNTGLGSIPASDVKKTVKYVEKNDGINIDRVIFPNKMQVGLTDTQFSSDLVVKGDLIVSGNLLGNGILTLSDGTSYLVAGSNITITSGTNGQITISSSGGGGGGGSSEVFKTVALASSTGGTQSGDSSVIADGSTDTLNLTAGAGITLAGNASSDTVTLSVSDWTKADSTHIHPTDFANVHLVIGGTSTSNGDIKLFSGGGAIFNDQSNDVDFRVESNDKTGALIIDGGTSQIILLG